MKTPERQDRTDYYTYLNDGNGGMTRDYSSRKGAKKPRKVSESELHAIRGKNFSRSSVLSSKNQKDE